MSQTMVLLGLVICDQTPAETGPRDVFFPFLPFDED